MESQSKYYWAIVAVASLAVLGMVFILSDALQKETSVPLPGSVVQREGTARLLIDFGNNRKRAFRGDVVVGMTVYDALVASREVGGFSLVLEGGGVQEIDGVKNNSREWHYYINGKPVVSAPQFEEVKPGDEIAFRFE